VDEAEAEAALVRPGILARRGLPAVAHRRLFSRAAPFRLYPMDAAS
jgi:hypothetical protein